MSSLSPQFPMISLFTCTCSCRLAAISILHRFKSPSVVGLVHNHVTPPSHHADIPLHRGAALTPSWLCHSFRRQNIGAAIWTPSCQLCTLHTEQRGGIKMDQSCLQQAACKGLSQKSLFNILI